MKNLGIFLTIAGAAASIWGFVYTSDHEIESIGEFFGVMDDTYKFANTIGPLGILIAVIGIVLLIIAVGKGRKSA
jgi:hypothetical protein